MIDNTMKKHLLDTHIVQNIPSLYTCPKCKSNRKYARHSCNNNNSGPGSATWRKKLYDIFDLNEEEFVKENENQNTFSCKLCGYTIKRRAKIMSLHIKDTLKLIVEKKMWKKKFQIKKKSLCGELFTYLNKKRKWEELTTANVFK